MRLQLTLDAPGDLHTLKVVRRELDLVEVSSTLLKRCGLAAISAVKEIAPELVLVAGTRTVDNGVLEARMAFKGGADAVSVLPSATRTAQAAVHDIAEECNGWVLVDASAGSDTTAAVLPFPSTFSHIAVRADHPLSQTSERQRRLEVSVLLTQPRRQLAETLSTRPDIIAVRPSAIERDYEGETQWIRRQLR
ncbi:3-hexulose-6-phosphate synthase [Microbacterium ginsengiterrae]|uniref:3-hexulose-6-phosphate synthase n=1 Tax=Microbacterium ginsengiterrae TaxID=546115 RepID=A0A7W9FAB9_9MICO|nr:hypothetical protein [Microbacterium ginsengiterrae]MBB5741955.1 3-hexulose-6-phosphate synthase [Microbacterium ginsengiterrae]